MAHAANKPCAELTARCAFAARWGHADCIPPARGSQEAPRLRVLGPIAGTFAGRAISLPHMGGTLEGGSLADGADGPGTRSGGSHVGTRMGGEEGPDGVVGVGTGGPGVAEGGDWGGQWFRAPRGGAGQYGAPAPGCKAGCAGSSIATRLVDGRSDKRLVCRRPWAVGHASRVSLRLAAGGRDLPHEPADLQQVVVALGVSATYWVLRQISCKLWPDPKGARNLPTLPSLPTYNRLGPAPAAAGTNYTPPPLARQRGNAMIPRQRGKECVACEPAFDGWLVPWLRSSRRPPRRLARA